MKRLEETNIFNNVDFKDRKCRDSCAYYRCDEWDGENEKFCNLYNEGLDTSTADENGDLDRVTECLSDFGIPTAVQGDLPKVYLRDMVNILRGLYFDGESNTVSNVAVGCALSDEELVERFAFYMGDKTLIKFIKNMEDGSGEDWRDLNPAEVLNIPQWNDFIELLDKYQGNEIDFSNVELLGEIIPDNCEDDDTKIKVYKDECGKLEDEYVFFVNKDNFLVGYAFLDSLENLRDTDKWFAVSS